MVLMEDMHLCTMRAQVGKRFHAGTCTCHTNHNADFIDVWSKGIEEQGYASDARPSYQRGDSLQTTNARIWRMVSIAAFAGPAVKGMVESIW